MGEKLSFNSLDLVTMTNVADLMSKMNDYLELVKPRFKQLFGPKVSEPSLRHLVNFTRYAFLKGSLIAGQGWMELGVGFYFHPEPCLKVWMWSDAKNETHSKLFSTVNEKVYLTQEDGFWLEGDRYFHFARPLSDFLSDDKMSESIEKWFIHKLELIKKFIKETQDLDWVLE